MLRGKRIRLAGAARGGAALAVEPGQNQSCRSLRRFANTPILLRTELIMSAESGHLKMSQICGFGIAHAELVTSERRKGARVPLIFVAGER